MNDEMAIGDNAHPLTTNVADLLVSALQEVGIDQVFALPGVQNDDLFDAFHRAGPRLGIIHSRHEQGAAYMATGAAMVTGRPSAFAVVPGPGILNTTAALCTAYACSARVLAITGQIPSALIGRGLGILHELPDQLGILERLTKWSGRVDKADAAPQVIGTAVEQLISDRPRPVAVEVPLNIWAQPTSGNVTAAARRPVLDPATVDAGATLLAGAKRPVIVVGGGAQDAAEPIRRLAERLGAPVIAHRMGHGVIDARHPLAANVVAGRHFWAEADLVIAIGTRLQFQQMAWGTTPDLPVLRIDVDAEEHDRIARPAVSLVGDAAEAVDALLAAAAVPSIDPDWAATVERVRQHAASEIAYLQPQIDYLGAIRRVLPDDGIFVDELTQLGYVSRLAFPVYRPRTFLSPGYQGTLGWGVATALGAKCARPDVPVVAVTGDGGFMFNVQELATAVQHRIAVTIILVNDGGFGNVRRTQIEDFGGRTIASDLRNPDFLMLAQSFGAHAVRVQSPAELATALTRSFAADLPTVIEIPAGAMPSPWPFLRFTRVRA